MAVSCMRSAPGHNFRNSSFIVPLWTWLWGRYHVSQNVFLIISKFRLHLFYTVFHCCIYVCYLLIRTSYVLSYLLTYWTNITRKQIAWQITGARMLCTFFHRFWTLTLEKLHLYPYVMLILFSWWSARCWRRTFMLRIAVYSDSTILLLLELLTYLLTYI